MNITITHYTGISKHKLELAGKKLIGSIKKETLEKRTLR